LAPPSTKGWDVLTPDGRRLQVKSRIVRDRKDAGQRQLSALRSWDFEELAVVLFNPDFTVWQAVTVTRDVVQTRARFSEHVNASRLMATAPLLALGAPIPGAPRRQDGSP
ncbi:MAG: hypothetical protein ACREQ5_29640, partial [Candidatus Dormibacteria bacterium]